MAMAVDAREAGSDRQIRQGITVRCKASPKRVQAAEFTLPRKTSKEKLGEPYPKPTQVDEENIQRRSSEGLLRNSAN